ncbi:hypothetical protein BXY58_2086 [Epilithonimonas arachidiradicis]|uniref:Uncharacterized protein n=1 Tax=Epilithonimonas arachidiradicis TaxID=1617282 RepID=A0A420D8S1_9FLAO|nr:hypothetical protein BXY58_2086 [Epilithonimonas arachidiradicis]
MLIFLILKLTMLDKLTIFNSIALLLKINTLKNLK